MSTIDVGARADRLHRAILASLAKRLGPSKFNAWFRGITRFSVHHGHVTLHVPNPFVGSWIESHFLADVHKALADATGAQRPVSVCVDPDLSRQFRRRQLDTQADQVARSTAGGARGATPSSAAPLRHRLGTFVVGPTNQMAYAAALVAAGGGEGFRPLYIHGGTGLGKSHLLQGICNAVATRGRHLRWRYVTGEHFTNECTVAAKRKRLPAFRAAYRQLDVLAVDDVHLLTSQPAIQTELLEVINAIDAAGKHAVAASDTHPGTVGQFTAPLVSRFLSGTVVKIGPPDLATRIKILRRRSAAAGLPVPEEVLRYIAMHVRGNVRELDGALQRLTARGAAQDGPITLPMATDALADHLALTDSALTLGEIESNVAAFFGLTPADLHSSRRTRTVSLARTIVMTLARRHTQMSYPEIGRAMGKNHSSVVLAVQRMERWLAAHGICTWMTPNGPRSADAVELLATLQAQLP